MELKSILEAAMLAAARPLNLDDLAGLFEEPERPAPSVLLTALEELDRDCEGRPVELKRVASGYRLTNYFASPSSVIKTLQEREWIHVVGHKEVPGRPALLATTRRFLDYFNLTSLSDLPPLHAFVEQLDNAAAETASPDAASAHLPLDTHDTDHAETHPTPAPEAPA